MNYQTLTYTIILIFAAMNSVANTPARKIQSIDALEKQVHAYAMTHFAQRLGSSSTSEDGHATPKEQGAKDINISVGQLDHRLRLTECDKKLTFEIQAPPRRSRNATVKTTCDSNMRWTLYVPINVDIYAQVLVSRHSLEKGHIITPDDLNQQRININTLSYGFIEDDDRILGMELKRPLKSGDPMRLSYLKYPDIVQKGQLVVVSKQSALLSVETEGVALGDGHLGERIRVRNQRSKRIVDAKVIAPGKVAITTR